jgi:hypothetical protein
MRWQQQIPALLHGLLGPDEQCLTFGTTLHATHEEARQSPDAPQRSRNVGSELEQRQATPLPVQGLGHHSVEPAQRCLRITRQPGRLRNELGVLVHLRFQQNRTLQGLKSQFHVGEAAQCNARHGNRHTSPLDRFELGDQPLYGPTEAQQAKRTPIGLLTSQIRKGATQQVDNFRIGERQERPQEHLHALLSAFAGTTGDERRTAQPLGFEATITMALSDLLDDARGPLGVLCTLSQAQHQRKRHTFGGHGTERGNGVRQCQRRITRPFEEARRPVM